MISNRKRTRSQLGNFVQGAPSFGEPGISTFGSPLGLMSTKHERERERKTRPEEEEMIIVASYLVLSLASSIGPHRD